MSEHFIDLSCRGCVGLQLHKAFPLLGPLSSCLLSPEEAAKKLIISEDTFAGDPAQVRIVPPY